MTAICPHGHTSQTTDYCDECGAPISPAGGAVPGATEVLPAVEDHDDADTSTTASPEPCPMCGTPRSGDDVFCEACGHDFRSPPATGNDVRAPRTSEGQWEVIVRPDRAQFERVAASGIRFPSEASERRVTLDGDQVRIGRSRGRDGVVPEIDLTGPFEDPGISRLHAVLERRDDGSYAVRDLDSTNGTALGDELTAVGTDAAVPLADGDVIRIGAWTTITVHSR